MILLVSNNIKPLINRINAAETVNAKVGIWKRFHDEKLGLSSIDDPFVAVGVDVVEGSADQSSLDGEGMSAEPVDTDQSLDSQGSEEE